MSAFLTGTAAEVIPVIKADGRVIGNGKPGSITDENDRSLPRIDARDRHADFCRERRVTRNRRRRCLVAGS